MKLHPISKDSRYTVTREHCGRETPRLVLRFCGEWIAQSKFYDSLVIRAVGHDAARNGALIIESIEA